MVQVLNATGRCCYPHCDKPVGEDEILCAEHKEAAKKAAEELLTEERKFYGPQWPSTQYESSDA